MTELRREHRARLKDLEDEILGIGARVIEMLDDALRALQDSDQALAETVVRADDLIDELSADVEETIFSILARQSPVASDLRVVTAFIYANIHLSRMGDLCVNIAKVARRVAEDDARDPQLLTQIHDMGQHSRNVTSRALEALGRRDVELARQLDELDDPVDTLNHAIFRRALEYAAGDESRLDWTMRMVLVARYLERIADHAVDLGGQTLFAAGPP